jgi:hypothetical protein
MRVAPVASVAVLLVASLPVAVRVVLPRASLPNGSASARTAKTGMLLIAHTDNNSVLSFAQTANGNVAPSATIVGTATQLNEPTAVYADSAGKIYVTSFGNNSIEVYAAGASGNQKPIQIFLDTRRC